MKRYVLSLGLLSLTSLSIILSGAPAQAVCIGTDVSTQVALHGSPDGVDQDNDASLYAESGCFGSTTTSADTQVYTGSGDNVSQQRESQHYLGGTYESDSYADPYLEGPVLFFPVETQVDVYTPPYDPAFQDTYYGGGVPYSLNFDAYGSDYNQG
jgi:hypothetical protein